MNYLFYKLRAAPFLFVLMLSLTTVAPAQSAAKQSYLEDLLQNPLLVGSGKFRVMFWDVYEASLYADDGQYSPDSNFALSLKYLRKLDGEKIVDKSIELIEAQGIKDAEKLDEWRASLSKVIPDVDKGDELSGIRTDKQTVFYFNNEPIGEISDPDLSRYFFNIWLAEDTTAPKLREALTGSK